MPLKQTLFTTLGVTCIALGAAGIVLPLLPTTPFLLLATCLLSRGDDRVHHWLLNQKHLAPYIHAFRNKSGLTRAQKIRVATSSTIMIAVSLWFVPVSVIKIGLALGWMVGMTFIYRIKSPASPAAPNLA